MRGRLVAASAALGLEPSAVEIDRLLAFLGLLQRWNAVYNLTAVRDVETMLALHLLDCLAIVPALRRHAGGRALRLLDVGSGAGLPGVVLAVMAGDWQVSCIDAVAKKATFIRQVALELDLNNLVAMHGRIETLVGEGPFDLVTSRAFASLRDLVTPTERLLAPGGVWAAMKGDPSAQELAEVPPQVEVFHVEPLTVPELEARRCLVWIRRRGG